MTHSRPLAGLAAVGLGVALPTFDLAVNVAFPAITAAFELRTQDIRWIVAAYLVTNSALMLGFGRLGDVVGHGRVFRAGVVASALSFVACGLAPTYDLLLAARMVQGVGAALVMGCGPALATSFFDETRRTWVLSAYVTMSAAAGVAAPLLGGASIAWLGWSGVFWFRLPVALAALAFLAVALPSASRGPLGSARYNGIAAAMLAAGLGSLLFAPVLLQSAAPPWQAPSLALAGVSLLAMFAIRQRDGHASLLPTGVFGSPGFYSTNLANVLANLVAFAVPLFVPYFLARVTGAGPLTIGVLIAMSPLGIMAGSALATPAVRRLGRRGTALAGGALLATVQFLIGHWDASTPPVAIALTLVFHGAGLGLFVVAYTDSVIGALPKEHRGVAGSLTVLTRTLGIIASVTLLTAAFHAFEAPRLQVRSAAVPAFLGAFEAVFQGSAVALAFAFAGFAAWRAALR